MNSQLQKAASLVRRELSRFHSEQPKRILFDHLPKCGGSTLNRYLAEHFPRNKVFAINGLKPRESVKQFKSFPENKRFRYDLVIGHAADQLIDFAHPSCLKVTVLRDPIERIVSHYFYARSNPEHHFYTQLRDSNMSLEDYASSNLSSELTNWYTSHFSGLCLKDTKANPEELVAKAAEVLERRYEIVGFLEEFPAFVEELRSRANLRYKYQGTKTNITQDKPSFSDIPKSTISTIEEINHLDVELYRRIRNNKE